MKDKILSAVIGAVISAVAALVVGIYSDLLPSVVPALQKVSAVIYVRVVLLLLIALGLVSVACVILYMKSKPYKPRALSGKAFGYQWSAELDYGIRPGETDIELQWLCPKHKVWLGIKSAEIPGTAYHRLWCMKCDDFYDMVVGGDTIYVEEASRIVKRSILSRIR